jgi:2-iminobutanoate/2-iminopropanoate deaminase
MRASFSAIGLLLVSLIACQPERDTQNPPAQQASEVEYLRSAATAELGLPFSDAVRVGNLLFVSGQIGNAPGTTVLVPGGIAAETRQSLENVRAILEAHGSSMDEVVKCTIMMADISEWAAMNEVYVTFFGERLPARSALGANGLALGARVEIECWATVGL